MDDEHQNPHEFSSQMYAVFEDLTERARSSAPKSAWTVPLLGIHVVPESRCAVFAGLVSVATTGAVEAISDAVAVRVPTHVLTDVDPSELVRRLLWREARLPISMLDDPRLLRRDDWPTLAESAGYLSDADIAIEAAAGDVLARAYELSKAGRLVIVLLSTRTEAEEVLKRLAAPIGGGGGALIIYACEATGTASCLPAPRDVHVIAIQREIRVEPDGRLIFYADHRDRAGAGRLTVHAYEPAKQALGHVALGDSNDEYEDVHDDPSRDKGLDDDDDYWIDQFPLDRALAMEPPPLAPLRHLTSEELASVIKFAEERAAALEGPDETRTIALFVAHLMPYFKGAAANGYASASIAQSAFDNALKCACSHLDDRTVEQMLQSVGVIEQVSPKGHWGKVWRAASFRLTADIVPFQPEAPTSPLHIRTPRKGELDRREASLRAAATGQGAAELGAFQVPTGWLAAGQIAAVLGQPGAYGQVGQLANALGLSDNPTMRVAQDVSDDGRNPKLFFSPEAISLIKDSWPDRRTIVATARKAKRQGALQQSKEEA